MLIFLSEISPDDKSLVNRQNNKLDRLTASPGIVAFLIISVALIFFLPRHSHGDIYRFVTIDGVESFTDTPQDKQAKVVIREFPRRGKKNGKTEKKHDVSLNEVVAKTVGVAINPLERGDSSVEPRLPHVGGVITSGVGMRIDPIDGKPRYHNGIDIAIREGTPVTAVAPGVVVYSGLRSGYGNTVLIEHANGMVTLYGHNSRLAISAGQFVDSSTIIAFSGNTGRSTGPHLHFEAWQAGTNVTPAFMPNSGKRLPLLTSAPAKARTRFHREVMADGSILFTNLPSRTR
jgi:murein DD-endopeptidase MepM/ murein hydrolase activator NlpD